MICSSKLFAGTSHHEQTKMQHYDHDKPEETCEVLTKIIPSIFDLAPCIKATSLNHHMSSGWHCAGPRRGGSRRPDGQTPTNFFPLLKSQISKISQDKRQSFWERQKNENNHSSSPHVPFYFLEVIQLRAGSDHKWTLKFHWFLWNSKSTYL